MSFIRPIGIGMIALLCATTTGACTPKYVKLTRQAEKAMASGDMEHAKEKYEKAIRKSPEYGPALIQMGTMHLKLREWEKAIPFFSKAIEVEPDNGRAYLGRGTARMNGGQFDSATEDYKKAKELGESSASAGIGMYLYLQGNYSAAMDELKLALEHNSDDFDSVLFVFKTAIASRDYANARQLLKRVPVLTVPAPRFPVNKSKRQATEYEDFAGETVFSDEDEAPLDEQKLEGAALLKHIRAELCYLAGDFPSAIAELSGIDDALSFGILYRDASSTLKSRLGTLGGAVVEYVQLGSPAALAEPGGIQPGDVITSFERKPIRSASEFEEAIESYEQRVAHEQVLIEVLRGDQQLAFRIVPGEFRTEDAIRSTANGSVLEDLSMAPDELLKFP